MNTDAAHRVVRLTRDDLQLRQDLPGLQAADAAQPTRRAEVAGERAADLRAETHGVLGGRQGLQRRGLPRAASLLQRAARLRIGQRDAHGLDLAPVGKLKEILQETVLGPAPFEDFQLGPLAGRVQRRPGGVRQAAHRSGREPHRPVAVEAGKDPGRDVGADAEARDGRRQRGAIQVAQVQRFGGARLHGGRNGSTLRPMPRPLARRLDGSRRIRLDDVDPADTLDIDKDEALEADRDARTRAVRAREPPHLRGHAGVAGRAPGTRRQRQGRDDPQDPRVQQHPAELRAPVQGADRGGACARLPVAGPQGGPAARPRDPVQPVPLRGRPGGARPPPGAGGDLESALRAHQRVRAADRRGLRRHRAEVLPAHQRRRAGRPAARA